jgi:hypothetical protein
MSHKYKKTTIPQVGYLYQNLVGLELLCSWLEDPSLYEWVQFEADLDEMPKGLDDVVALGRDEKYVLRQVKFTVDASDPANELTWDWLLVHKPNGRSLLQKWADAIFAIEREQLRLADLVTNRRPSREFALALSSEGRNVDWEKIEPTTRDVVVEQLGGVERAQSFFSLFEFQHSYKGFEALDRTLVDRLIPRFTDRYGWLTLLVEATYWAVTKGCPPPLGRITLDVLRGTLSARRSRPLEQSFRVPDGYEPPDTSFASQFISSLENREVVVLWGSPGQGKSTFISYVCSELEKQEIPFIRHHYFLNLADRSDRFTLERVAGSLMAQMEARHLEFVQGLSPTAENLRSWIEACALGYEQRGKKFVVVVDGLDHVWRENDQDKRPLDSLFAVVFPVSKNVTVAIGTQKVHSRQLPQHFERFVSAESWVELPRMSLTSIGNWLRVQLLVSRFELAKGRRDGESDQLTPLAVSFQRVSEGHPLVLTYCFESLVRIHRTLDAATLDAQNWKPEGDIKKYYAMLWDRLSFEAKDALHLLASAGFIWPPLGLESCLHVDAGHLAREIGHLLHNTEAGQVAFHGSLYAFVAEDHEHMNRTSQLNPAVVDWLARQAPAFHRWGWLWLYEHALGQSTNLLSKPDRNWVIESLALGYPSEQIEEILAAAETTAFQSGDFANAVRLRWLKTRLLNGPEFQIDDFDSLIDCALQLTDDEFPIKTLAASLQTAGVERLHLLGTQYLLAGRKVEAIECLGLMRQRINDRWQLGAYDRQSLKDAGEKYLELAAAIPQFEPAKIIANIRQIGRQDSAELLSRFLHKLAEAHDLAPLMGFVQIPMPLAMRSELEISCVRLAGRMSVCLHDWPEFQRFRKHPLSQCWRLLYRPESYIPFHYSDFNESLDVDRYTELQKRDATQYLHRLFFTKVLRALAQSGAQCPVPAPKYDRRPWFSTAALHIVRAGNIIGNILAKGESPAFAQLFRILNDVSAPSKFEERSDYFHFKSAVTAAATDLFLLTSLRSGVSRISASEWESANSSEHFNRSEWFDLYAGRGSDLIDRIVIAEDLSRRQRDIASSVMPFNEMTSSYADLCSLATKFELPDLANKLLRKSLACVISYGWRKDPSLSHVIESIEAMAARDGAFASEMLRRISPAVASIYETTEDSGTRPSDLTELILTLTPSAFPAYYRHWLNSSDWYTAETVFTQFLESQSLDGIGIELTTAAVWDIGAISTLRKRAEAGDAKAATIADMNLKRFGLSPEAEAESTDKSSKSTDEPDIDIREYLLGNISELLEDLRAKNAYVAERRLVREWFEYWVASGRGVEVLRELKKHLESERIRSGVTEALDSAFAASLALEGKQRAYHWLVAAQIHQRGWNEHFDSGSALARFEAVARHYRKDWRQFIVDTTKPEHAFPEGSLVIPHERLVHFLLAVDEIAIARELIKAMVNVTVDDFAEQPLVTPPWLEMASS